MEMEVDVENSENLPAHTLVYKLDSGTTFYYKFKSPKRLYVKSTRKKIQAKLPPGDIRNMGAHGNALYFSSTMTIFEETSETKARLLHLLTLNKQVQLYKAILTAEKTVHVTLLRDTFENENVHWEGLCSQRTREGQTIIYRMCDQLELEGIREVPKKNKIHRGKKLFAQGVGCVTSLHALNENALILELSNRPRYSRFFAPDPSSSVYFAFERRLFVLNIETMDLLPLVRFRCNMNPLVDEERSMGLPLLDSSLCGMQDVTAMSFLGSEGANCCLYAAEIPKLLIEAIVEEELADTSEPVNKLTSLIESGRRFMRRLQFNEGEPVFHSKFAQKFKPIQIIGQGAYGCVFEVEDPMDKRRYAVKRIPLCGKDRELRDALREVMMLSSFANPGIVRYEHSWSEHPPEDWQRRSDDKVLKKLHSKERFNYKERCSFLYIQMELCEYTLAQWLRDNEDRYLRRMKWWFKQIVAAVAYIHDQGYIHRDLKPSNILFASEDCLKICDLGIAASRAVRNGQEIAQTRTLDRGTVLYMAPEQRGFTYTSKVDIFSLGLILAEMCVVMTADETARAFELYQRGRAPRILRHLPQVDQFVAWLAAHRDIDRPNCRDILEHTFLNYT